MVASTRARVSKHIGGARISKSGQATAPARLRRELGLEPGDTVVYGRNKDGKVAIRKPHTAAQLAGNARRPPDGMSVSELINETDGSQGM